MSSYATTAEFDVHGIRPAALPAAISSGDKTAAITAASGKADSYLASRFRLPLLSWGTDLTQAVCAMAAFELIATLMLFQPEASANAVLMERNERAVKWLTQVSKGEATPAGIVESEPAESTVSRIYSSPPRGW